jgi:UDP-glucose 4-epimerase
LITGGAGFIGSHLAERLLDEGQQVLILDDLTTGRMRNIEHLVGHDRFEYRVGSIRDAPLVIELVDRCDAAIHLAAAVGVKLIVKDPVRTIETNVHGTQVILDAVARKGKPLLLASTSEVYGKSAKIPFREDDDLVLGATIHSRWSYACSKALDEWLCLAYAHQRELPVTIVRLFNTVGPRQTGHYGMVLPRFVSQALDAAPLTIYGTGEQSRCFSHVSDVVESLVRLLFTPEAVGGVFNVGSQREVTIRQLAEMVRDATGSDSPLVTIPYEKAYDRGFEDMPRRVPDVSKLERTIGYKPATPLEQIIADVVAEEREQRLLAGPLPAHGRLWDSPSVEPAGDSSGLPAVTSALGSFSARSVEQPQGA